MFLELLVLVPCTWLSWQFVSLYSQFCYRIGSASDVSPSRTGGLKSALAEVRGSSLQ